MILMQVEKTRSKLLLYICDLYRCLFVLFSHLVVQLLMHLIPS